MTPAFCSEACRERSPDLRAPVGVEDKSSGARLPLECRAASMRLVLSSAFLQIFLLLFFRKHALLAASRPTEGVLRGRHGRRVRDAVGVSGRSAGFSCGRTIGATMKSCGSGIPELMPSFAMMLAHRRETTGARQPVPGKSAYKS